MKVLFISSWYPNSTDPLKGIFVKKHAAAIKTAGVEIQVLAITVNHSSKFFKKSIHKATDEAGIVTHLIELNSRFYKFIHLALRMQSRLLQKYYFKSIKSGFQPDIIHSNVLYPAAILGSQLAKKEGLPHLITEHWSKVDKFMSKSLNAREGKKAYDSAKAITVVSSFLQKNIAKHLNDPSKICVVPNVVNAKVFTYKEKRANSDSISFVCAAHWSNPKRPDLIFNSLQKASKELGKKIILNVVGTGQLMEDLKQKNWPLEINYYGKLNPEKIAELLHASDFFLHASNMETFSIVIAEALSTGTPVLASKVGAIPELININNGLTVENSELDWTNAVLQLCKSTFDHQKIAEQAGNYSSETIGSEFARIYQQVIN